MLCSSLMNGENNLRLKSPFSESKEHPDTRVFSVEGWQETDVINVSFKLRLY